MQIPHRARTELKQVQSSDILRARNFSFVSGDKKVKPVIGMRIVFLIMAFAATIAHATELSSAPASLRSLNGTGFSPWQNLDDARCDTPSAAAAECYARADTEILEARGFDFDIPNIRWLEARWDVSISPVPADGWSLRMLQLRWGDSMIDLASPNYTSHDENVALFIRVAGLVDWHNVSMLIAFESTNEDATFLLSCVELRAGDDRTTSEPQAPRIFHYEFGLAVGIAIVVLAGYVRRRRSRRRELRRGVDAFELTEIAPSV